MISESELVRLAAAGDDRAFRDLVAPYRRRVIGLAVKWLNGDGETAEDIWQDVQFRVFRNLSRIDRSRKFSSWLMTIAGNLTKNELRRRRRHRCLIPIADLSESAGGEERLLQLQSHARRPDQICEDEEATTAVAAAMLQLTPAQRQVFELREIRGKSYEEIAKAAGTKVGTVKSRLNRARAAVAARVA